MQHNQSKSILAAILVASAFPLLTVGIERDARFIVGFGYDYSEVADAELNSYGAAAEIALTKSGSFGLLIGAGALEGDSFYAPDGQYYNAGFSWYPTKTLKIMLQAFSNKIDGQDAYYGGSSYTFMNNVKVIYGVWDTESETQGISLSMKYFIYQQSPKFTPYLLASVGMSQTETDASGTIGWEAKPGIIWTSTGSPYKTFPASTNVEYDFDDTFRGSVGAGFDFLLSESVSLGAAAIFGVIDSGGEFWILGTERVFFGGKDNYYSIGGALRFYL